MRGAQDESEPLIWPVTLALDTDPAAPPAGRCAPICHRKVTLRAALTFQLSNTRRPPLHQAQVLRTFHRELTSLFLYYALLEQYDAGHWPPRMALGQWVAFLRDADTAVAAQGGRFRCEIGWLLAIWG